MIELDVRPRYGFMNDSLDVVGKNSLINLVTDHKHTCHGCNCGISLYTIRLFLECNGIVFTEEERKLFI